MPCLYCTLLRTAHFHCAHNGTWINFEWTFVISSQGDLGLSNHSILELALQLEQRTQLRAWPNYGPSTYPLSLLYRRAPSLEVTTSTQGGILLYPLDLLIDRLIFLTIDKRDYSKNNFDFFEVAFLRLLSYGWKTLYVYLAIITKFHMRTEWFVSAQVDKFTLHESSSRRQIYLDAQTACTA